MKEIKAIIRAERVHEVLDALGSAGIVNATLSHVLAVGPNLDASVQRVSLEFGRQVNRMVKVELVCPDRDEMRLVDLLRGAAHTGQPGDGVVAVKNVNRLVKIRNAKESTDAL